MSTKLLAHYSVYCPGSSTELEDNVVLINLPEIARCNTEERSYLGKGLELTLKVLALKFIVMVDYFSNLIVVKKNLAKLQKILYHHSKIFFVINGQRNCFG